ncbi:peptidylprolyl isomerase [Croceicoccus marinus]|uniref:Parvulin-like PPIase n=1 Tax=Croceicoccus marinus TaxID=450378 RepID=A0A7G6VW08_9SPHN|nr:peptidylprolyl isomerase [Croceicoccus marinus]QNE05923.1 peptidylprolyl isomerase [Croceicoccus marinus]
MTTSLTIAGLQRAATGVSAAALMAASLAGAPAFAQDRAEPALVAQDQAASPSIGMIEDGAQGDADSNVRTASAKVNGEIITQTDIDQRVAWIEATTQRRLVPQEREQVVQQLVDELIQIQNARESEITITSDEVVQMYDRYAQRELGITSAELDELTRSVGSSPASLQRMLLAQAAWQQLLRRNVAPLVNVSAREVNEQIDRMKADKGTNEYRLGEIYIAAPAGSDAQVEQRMQAIMAQLQETGDFASVAAQYSQASTAARGGDLGFVRLDRLPPELATVVPAMQVGELQGPIPCCGGYSILYMRDKRQVMVADPRDGMVSLAQITINMPAGLSMDAMNRFAADFGQKTQSLTGGCSTVEAQARQIGAEAVLVDQISIRQLPSQLQEMVLATPDGGVTRPYGVAASEASQPLRAMMVCGRTDPPMLDGPTSDQVMEQLENERIERRAQNYMRDLRRDAIVERN